MLVEANGLFLADIPGDSTALEAAYRAPYAFDQRNSSFVHVRATDDMATFQVSAHFALPKVPAPPQTPNPGAAPPVPLPGTPGPAQHVPRLPLQPREAARRADGHAQRRSARGALRHAPA